MPSIRREIIRARRGAFTVTNEGTKQERPRMLQLDYSHYVIDLTQGLMGFKTYAEKKAAIKRGAHAITNAQARILYQDLNIAQRALKD